MLTALDQIANQNHLQLLKATIPYIDSSSQKMVSLFIKVLEMQNILRFYEHTGNCVQACNTGADSPGMIDMLTDMRSYCDESEGEMIDQCIQLLSTLELYSIFAQSGADPSALF